MNLYEFQNLSENIKSLQAAGLDVKMSINDVITMVHELIVEKEVDIQKEFQSRIDNMRALYETNKNSLKKQLDKSYNDLDLCKKELRQLKEVQDTIIKREQSTNEMNKELQAKLEAAEAVLKHVGVGENTAEGPYRPFYDFIYDKIQGHTMDEDGFHEIKDDAGIQ